MLAPPLFTFGVGVAVGVVGVGVGEAEVAGVAGLEVAKLSLLCLEAGWLVVSSLRAGRFGGGAMMAEA